MEDFNKCHENFIKHRQPSKTAVQIARWLWMGVVGVIAIADLATYLCSKSDAVLHFMNPFVDFMDGITSARRMASKSNYPDVASVYYSIIIFIVPLCAVCFVMYACFVKAWFKDPYSLKKRLLRPFAALFFAVIVVGFFLSMEGQDARQLHVGTSFQTLLSMGWTVFAGMGVLIGHIAIDLWKIITGR